VRERLLRDLARVGRGLGAPSRKHERKPRTASPPRPARRSSMFLDTFLCGLHGPQGTHGPISPRPPGSRQVIVRTRAAGGSARPAAR
jgi:hypothetical protein